MPRSSPSLICSAVEDNYVQSKEITSKAQAKMSQMKNSEREESEDGSGDSDSLDIPPVCMLLTAPAGPVALAQKVGAITRRWLVHRCQADRK